MNWDFIHYMPAFYMLAFALIWICDKTDSKSVWLILAAHSTLNLILNYLVFPIIEHDPALITIAYTTIDVATVVLLCSLINRIAYAQSAIITIAIAHQWITVSNISEPLILALGFAQLLLGYNAIAAAIGNTHKALLNSRSAPRPVHSSNHVSGKAH